MQVLCLLTLWKFSVQQFLLSMFIREVSGWKWWWVPVLLDSGETEATKSRICGLLATQIGFFPNHNTKPKKKKKNWTYPNSNQTKKMPAWELPIGGVMLCIAKWLSPIYLVILHHLRFYFQFTEMGFWRWGLYSGSGVCMCVYTLPHTCARWQRSHGGLWESVCRCHLLFVE